MKQFKHKLLTCLSVMAIALLLGTLLPANIAQAATTPAQVTISSIKSTGYDRIKLTWEKAKNAEKYEVYRATSSTGTYKKVKTLTGTSYTNTGLTIGKKYYYKVRAIKGTQTGKFSAVKSATPKLSKPVVSIYKSLWGINSYWNRVSGADGYEIYRATSQDGTYTKLKKQSSDYYEDDTAQANKTYYYKVRAYRKENSKTYYSSYSSVKSAMITVNKTEESANVIVKGTKLSDGEVVLEITNNNSDNVDVTVRVEALNSSNKCIGSHAVKIGNVEAHTKAYESIYLFDSDKLIENFTSFKIVFEANKITSTTHVDDLVITELLNRRGRYYFEIVNTAQIPLEEVYIAFVGFDVSGKIVEYDYDFVDDLGPGEKDMFYFYSDKPIHHYLICPRILYEETIE